MVAEAGAAGRALPDRLQWPARQPGRDRASLRDPPRVLLADLPNRCGSGSPAMRS